MIPPEIDIHPSAVTEGRKAYQWYLRRSISAGRRFQAALEAALVQIAQSPARWPTYLLGTRYRLLRRFPFHRGLSTSSRSIADRSRSPRQAKALVLAEET